MTRAVLDYEAYPHILEAVLEYASPAALLALRACSRYMRAQVDQRLFRHVEIIFPDQSTGIDVAVKPFGSSLRFEWLRDPPFTYPDDWPEEYKVPGTPPPHEPEDPDGPARVALRAYIAEQMSRARVLDLSLEEHSEASREATSTLLFEMSQDDVWANTSLRLFGSDYGGMFRGWSGLREAISFGHVECDCVQRRFVRTLLCRPTVIASGMHISLDPIAEPSWSAAPVEMIVHLLQSSDEYSDEYSDLNMFMPHATANAVEQLVRLPFIEPYHGSERTTRITVVGGAQECRAVVGLFPFATQDEFYAALDRTALALREVLLWAHQTAAPPEAIRTHLRGHLRFISPAEYEAEVGPEQVALETQRDPRTGPPAAYIP